jgi:hypothetical protein
MEYKSTCYKSITQWQSTVYSPTIRLDNSSPKNAHTWAGPPLTKDLPLWQKLVYKKWRMDCLEENNLLRQEPATIHPRDDLTHSPLQPLSPLPNDFPSPISTIWTPSPLWSTSMMLHPWFSWTPSPHTGLHTTSPVA